MFCLKYKYKCSFVQLIFIITSLATIFAVMKKHLVALCLVWIGFIELQAQTTKIQTLSFDSAAFALNRKELTSMDASSIR